MTKRLFQSKTIILLAGLVLGAVGMTCAQKNGQAPKSISDAADTVSQVFAPTPAFAQASPDSSSITVADIAERAVPSVVNISAVKVLKPQQSKSFPFFGDPSLREFFGRPFGGIPKERRQSSLGSGVIVSAEGIVITNNHVVEHAEEVEVSLADGRDFEAEVVGTDPKSDLAVLRLQGDIKDLTPLSLGDSSELRLGEVVIAIGNPFGVGQTVTMGIISAKGRANVGIVDYEDFIQTDAAINPGNSGGALVNMKGELIGVNTAILSRSGGYQGVGFAIPTNLVKPVMDSLVEHGKVVRGWLGVAIQDLNNELAKGLGLKRDKGVLISDVSSGGPAEAAGILRGDVVVSMNGKEMANTAKLRNAIAIAGPGAKAAFQVLRDGKSIQLTATLGELPAQGVVKSNPAGTEEGAFEGAVLGNLSDSSRKRFGIPNRVTEGVVVTRVEPDSRASRSGLRAGDVIVELNRKPVHNIGVLRKLHSASEGTLLLLVQRQNSTMYLAIEK